MNNIVYMMEFDKRVKKVEKLKPALKEAQDILSKQHCARTVLTMYGEAVKELADFTQENKCD